MSLDEAAAELYAMDPGEFTKARNARAAAARDAGDDDLAAAIRALHRPTASATLLNALAREEPAKVEELLDLGQQLQDAQDRGAGEDLRAALKARQRLIAALLREVERLGVDRGARPSLAVQREVQTSLLAAMTDAAAAATVRKATLSSAIDLADVGGSDSKPQSGSSGKTSSTTQKSGAAAAKRATAVAAKQAASERAQRKAATRRLEADLARIDDKLAAANQQVERLRQERAAAVLRLTATRRSHPGD